MQGRWQHGQPLGSIDPSFGRASSSFFPHLGTHWRNKAPSRVRSRLALTLIKRNRVSRRVAADLSFRAIALNLARALSTISQQVGRFARSKVCKFSFNEPLCRLIALRLRLKWFLSRSPAGRGPASRKRGAPRLPRDDLPKPLRPEPWGSEERNARLPARPPRNAALEAQDAERAEAA